MKKIFVFILLTIISNVSFAGGYEMTCHVKAASMCGEYSFSSESDLSSFEKQCVSGGGSVISGSCPSGGTGCYHATGDKDVTTYIYGSDSSQVKSMCKQNGGTVK